MLTLGIPESGRASIPKPEENLKTGVHLKHIVSGWYTLGCFGAHTGILLSQCNSKSLALAKYLR